MKPVVTHFYTLPDPIKAAVLAMQSAAEDAVRARLDAEAADARAEQARAALAQAIGDWQRESVRVAVADTVAAPEKPLPTFGELYGPLPGA